VPFPALSLAVVGADYPNPGRKPLSRRFEIELCQPGEPVDLRLEPTNKADPLAVAVYSARGIQIGYLTAERCSLIGGRIRLGHEVMAVFQRKASYGALIRVAFDGELPALPADPSGSESSDPDFWPDPEWPDK
jgi:hypothetical protein